MAEYVEVIKQSERMCKSFGTCSGCPLEETCIYLPHYEPERVEKIVMEWAKKHPEKTNKDKFKEVFGDETAFSFLGCRFGFHCPDVLSCKECDYKDFWDQEYKEPALFEMAKSDKEDEI